MTKAATHPLLLSLQSADAVLQIAARVGGPRAPRTMFTERTGRGELPEYQIVSAHRHAWAVSMLIHDQVARRVVALSMETANAHARYTIREVAATVGVSKSSAHRKLGDGLFFIGDLMGRMFGDEDHREAA